MPSAVPPGLRHHAAGGRPKRAARVGTWGGHPDPFAVAPVRRSTVLVVASAVSLFGPLILGGEAGTTFLLAGGWLGLVGLALGLPILALSLLEAAWVGLRRRLDPPVEELDLPPRLPHLLRRHGYASIALVERTPDPALLLLPNLDRRALHAVRRAIALRRYRRWQEAGFP